MNDRPGTKTMQAASGERFHCTHCNYMRPLRPSEDGFQLYLQHAIFCNPASRDQLWLPILVGGGRIDT